MIGNRIDGLMSRISWPSSGVGVDQIEAGRILEAEDELAVGELIDAGELHFDDACAAAPTEPRRSCGRTPRASFAAARICSLPTRSGRLKSYGVIFSRAWRGGAAARCERRRSLAAVHRAEQAFDFRLAENVAHRRTPLRGDRRELERIRSFATLRSAQALTIRYSRTCPFP